VTSPTTIVWVSHGSEETADLGRRLAVLVTPGDLILLHGDLGTGKTTLTRALARSLGVTAPVTSPTFALAQRYVGQTPMVHVDAYRLQGADEEELGLLLDDAGDAVTVIEWPEHLSAPLGAPRMEIHLAHRGGDERLVAFESAFPDTRSALAEIVADLRARYIHTES
jgi:tRNA threonylcarbamoyladenosine biosynthesis protein TsaE